MLKSLLVLLTLFPFISKSQSQVTFPQAKINGLQNPSTGTNQKQISLSTNKETVRSVQSAFNTYQSFKLPDVGSASTLSIDTLIVGDVPNDTVIITGNWTHTGPIWVFNDGVLIFHNANVIDTGDVYVFGHGQLLADSSSFYFPQNYFYERSLLAVQNGFISMNNCSLNYSGMSHNLLVSDSAVVQMNYIHQNDWTTCGLWGHSVITINHCNLGGEYILSSYTNATFNNVDTLILWHQFPDSAVINFSFPSADTVNAYQFNSTILGVSGVGYTVSADSCTDVMWAIMPVNGSVVSLSSSTIRAIGVWVTHGVTEYVSNIFDNSSYTSYTAPLTEHNIQLVNCDVQTWSIYVFDSSGVIIDNSILGEVGAQSHGTIQGTSFIVDGSGGYMWTTDTSAAMVSGVGIYSTARSERNGIFVLAYSDVRFLSPSAIGTSAMLCIQDNFPGDPIPYDGSIVWMQKISSPDTAYIDSLNTITGSAWIDQGPLGNLMDFGSYSLFFSDTTNINWIPITLDSIIEIRQSILANWNTNGVTPGNYFLKLVVKNNFGDSAQAVKFLKVNSIINSINELDSKCVAVFPNPTSGEIHIRTSISPADFILYDQTGRIIFQQRINSQEIEISLNGIADGVYHYIIQDSEIKSYGKIVILKPGL